MSGHWVGGRRNLEKKGGGIWNGGWYLEADGTIKPGKGEKHRRNPHLSMHAVRSISVALISRCCFLLEVDERRLWKSIPLMAE